MKLISLSTVGVVLAQTTTTMTSYTTTIATTTLASRADTQLFTLLDSLKLVFEKNRVEGRPHLEMRWTKITEKWHKRNEDMTRPHSKSSASCLFDGRSFDMTLTDLTDSCQVSFSNMDFDHM